MVKSQAKTLGNDCIHYFVAVVNLLDAQSNQNMENVPIFDYILVA
jgi:hypothetical protein